MAARCRKASLVLLDPLKPARSHTHETPEIVYVLTGEYSAPLVGGAAGRPGDVFYFPAGVAHAGSFPTDRTTQILVLQWTGGPDWPEPFRLRDQTGRLLTALLWMWDLQPVAGPEEQAAVDGLLAALLHAVNRQRHLSLPDGSPVARARELMDGSPAAIVDLEELARTVQMSPSHLSRLFRQATGLSPMKYLRLRRLERAMELIVNTRLPLQTIAGQVGLASGFHLSRQIKHHFGRSPSEFRRPDAPPRVSDRTTAGR